MDHRDTKRRRTEFAAAPARRRVVPCRRCSRSFKHSHCGHCNRAFKNPEGCQKHEGEHKIKRSLPPVPVPGTVSSKMVEKAVLATLGKRPTTPLRFRADIRPAVQQQLCTNESTVGAALKRLVSARKIVVENCSSYILASQVPAWKEALEDEVCRVLAGVTSSPRTVDQIAALLDPAVYTPCGISKSNHQTLRRVLATMLDAAALVKFGRRGYVLVEHRADVPPAAPGLSVNDPLPIEKSKPVSPSSLHQNAAIAALRACPAVPLSFAAILAECGGANMDESDVSCFIGAIGKLQRANLVVTFHVMKSIKTEIGLENRRVKFYALAAQAAVAKEWISQRATVEATRTDELHAQITAEAQPMIFAVLAETPLEPVPFNVLATRLTGLRLARTRLQSILEDLQDEKRDEGERIVRFDDSTKPRFILASYHEAARVKGSPWRKRRLQGVLEIVNSHGEIPAGATEVVTGLDLLFADEFSDEPALKPSSADVRADLKRLDKLHLISAIAADSKTGEYQYVLAEHEHVARSKAAQEDVLDEVYYAKLNDTPVGIAQRFNVDAAELVRINHDLFPTLTQKSKLRDGTGPICLPHIKLTTPPKVKTKPFINLAGYTPAAKRALFQNSPSHGSAASSSSCAPSTAKRPSPSANARGKRRMTTPPDAWEAASAVKVLRRDMQLQTVQEELRQLKAELATKSYQSTQVASQALQGVADATQSKRAAVRHAAGLNDRLEAMRRTADNLRRQVDLLQPKVGALEQRVTEMTDEANDRRQKSKVELTAKLSAVTAKHKAEVAQLKKERKSARCQLASATSRHQLEKVKAELLVSKLDTLKSTQQKLAAAEARIKSLEEDACYQEREYGVCASFIQYQLDAIERLKDLAELYGAPLDDVDRNGAVLAQQPKKTTDCPHPLEASSKADVAKQTQGCATCSNLRGRRVEVWWEDDDAFYTGKVVDQDFEDYTFQILYEADDKLSWHSMDPNETQWRLAMVKGTDLRGQRVEVWWDDRRFYAGSVVDQDCNKNLFQIHYDDGTVSWHSMDQNRTRWRTTKGKEAKGKGKGKAKARN